MLRNVFHPAVAAAVAIGALTLMVCLGCLMYLIWTI